MSIWSKIHSNETQTDSFRKIFKIRNIQKLYNFQVVCFIRPKEDTIIIGCPTEISVVSDDRATVKIDHCQKWQLLQIFPATSSCYKNEGKKLLHARQANTRKCHKKKRDNSERNVGSKGRILSNFEQCACPRNDDTSGTLL